MKPWAEHFYKSQQWQHVRDYVMKRDRMLCQDCLAKGLTVPAEEVHHIIPLQPENITDPSITLDENTEEVLRSIQRQLGNDWTEEGVSDVLKTIDSNKIKIFQPSFVENPVLQ